MSKRLKRIALLVSLAQKETDRSLQTLGALRSQLVALQEQLNSLKNYLSDYISRINTNGLKLFPIQLQSTYGFVDRLNTAISAENNKVAEMDAFVVKAEEDWFEKRGRLKAMEKLYEKIKKNEQSAANSQEQKMLDDLSAQQFTRKSSHRL